MIAVLFILAGAILIGGLIGAFWEKIKSFFIDLMPKIKAKLKIVVEGVKVAAKRLSDKIYQIRLKNYSKTEAGLWKETIVTKELNQNDVPKEYRQSINLDDEFDMTEQFREHLVLEL